MEAPDGDCFVGNDRHGSELERIGVRFGDGPPGDYWAERASGYRSAL